MKHKITILPLFYSSLKSSNTRAPVITIVYVSSLQVCVDLVAEGIAGSNCRFETPVLRQLVPVDDGTWKGEYLRLFLREEWTYPQHESTQITYHSV